MYRTFILYFCLIFSALNSFASDAPPQELTQKSLALNLSALPRLLTEADFAQPSCAQTQGEDLCEYLPQDGAARIVQHIDETLKNRCSHCGGFCADPPLRPLERTASEESTAHTVSSGSYDASDDASNCCPYQEDEVCYACVACVSTCPCCFQFCEVGVSKEGTTPCPLLEVALQKYHARHGQPPKALDDVTRDSKLQERPVTATSAIPPAGASPPGAPLMAPVSAFHRPKMPSLQLGFLDTHPKENGK